MTVHNPVNPQCYNAYLASPCHIPQTPCGTIFTANQIGYNGPNLPCTGIQTCNNMELAIQKIDDQICQLKGISPLYKEYYANISQTGTSDPVVSVIFNNIGNIVWTRGGQGVYLGDLTGGFSFSNTVILLNAGFSYFFANGITVNNNQVMLLTVDPLTQIAEDDGFNTGVMHIKVFYTTTTTTTIP